MRIEVAAPEPPLLAFSVMILKILFLCLVQGGAWAATPDWSVGAEIPDNGRANPYEFSTDEFKLRRHAGRIHAVAYPVPTGLHLPYRPLKNLIEAKSDNPLKKILQKIVSWGIPFNTFAELQWYLGLSPYPEVSSTPDDLSPYSFPGTFEKSRDLRMGLTLRRKNGVETFTAGCAGCHVGQLFGKAVFGLTNRFPRANDFFVWGTRAFQIPPRPVLQALTEADENEMAVFDDAKERIKFIGTKKPLALGLDTSLAQVSLSLAHRAPDGIASKDEYWARHPRSEKLAKIPADSKPAVWWNLKYKTRWLSDGSIVSGNPILTNFLWNEIGRGADLVELEHWIDQNPDIVAELTTAVFSAKPPRFTDFFPVEHFDLERLQRGQKLFRQKCAKCHGIYVKKWETVGRKNWASAGLKTLIETEKVVYSTKTPPMNIGTDEHRFRGMSSLQQLNRLRISKKNGIVVKVRNGYIPPPLVGIWARWPYLHNNSVPNLLSLLTRADWRPKRFMVREAIDKEKDFNREKNGYPTLIPLNEDEQKPQRFMFDTRQPGLSNQGHDAGIILDGNGREIFSENEKFDLVHYLQTL